MLPAKGSEVRPEEAQLRVPGMASGGASEDSKGQAVAGSAGEEQDDPGSSHQSGRARDLGTGPGGWDSREERRVVSLGCGWQIGGVARPGVSVLTDWLSKALRTSGHLNCSA